jgi:hypothetical protein
MWIALNDGFISVVQADMKLLPKAERRHNRGTGMLTVRARNADQLKRLFPGRNIYRWPGRDYPARIFIAREDFAKFIAERAGSIDYGNFKNSVRDNELHDAYMALWSVMHGYQYGRYKARPSADYGQHDFTWERGYPVQSQPTDQLQARKARAAGWNVDFPEEDGTCGLLGCAPDQPCIECLTEALRDANERATGAEPDRFGDFDEEVDADAQSHLRAPPK